MALAVVAANAFALSSCNNRGYAPPVEMPVNVQNVSNDTTQSLDAEQPLGMEIPELVTACPAGTPGHRYVDLFAQGNVVSGTFTPAAGPGHALWARYLYVAASPSPTPKPTLTPKPTPTPTPQPIWIYLGSYIVKNGALTDTVGCAVLITTQNGRPLRGSTFNATDSEAPRFTVHVRAILVTFGSIVSLRITNLSATGGKGTFTLSNRETGTITLTQRIPSHDWNEPTIER